MEMDGLDDIYKYNRFAPSAEDAVTYYLPRLLAGDSTLHGAEKLIHHADIYSCEPKDLAYHYAPAPQAVGSGDRFFFTTCRRKNGSRARSARVAGAGTWTVNKTKAVYNRARAKVGEVKNLSFKKGEACTGWVMEEYRCLLPEALVADGEMVLCKIHLSPSASAATRQESAAYLMRRQEPVEPPVHEAEAFTVTASATHVEKRPAEPVAAADLSSSKRMRMTAPVPTPDEEYQDCPDWSFAPAPPVSSPAAAGSAPAEAEDNMDESSSFKRMRMADPVPAPEEEYQDCPDWSFAPAPPVSSPAAGSASAEAEDNMDRFSCTLEELLGGPQEEDSKEEDENNTEQAEPHSDWKSGDLEELEMFLADGDDEEEERQAKETEEFMAGINKWCNNNAPAADLHSGSADGQRSQFFSFATVN